MNDGAIFAYQTIYVTSSFVFYLFREGVHILEQKDWVKTKSVTTYNQVKNAGYNIHQTPN